MNAWLTLHYLPSVSWCSCFLRAGEVWIEQYDSFQKSTGRNRCSIATAQGKRNLSIPVKGGRDHHQLYRDVKISYDLPWQKNHWHSIKAAYGSAPYFAHYESSFAPFYQQRFQFLFDFNLQMLQMLCRVLKVPPQIKLTNGFEKALPAGTDFRSEKELQTLQPHRPYHQVFAERHGFISHLSILDLLMNEGPHAKEFLRA